MLTSKLDAFSAQGVRFTGNSGDNHYGYCPFSQKENKLYVNAKNGLWDSKTTGLHGNLQDFLGFMFSRVYATALTRSDLIKLSKDRGLPIEAFEDVPIGKQGEKYVIPMRDHKGKVCDIRTYRLGKKLMSSKGCHSGLWGMDSLLKIQDKNVPVYICEGEWDSTAMKWLLTIAKQPGIVVGIPGAAMFPKEWWPLLAGKNIITLYDNDLAGEEGESKAFRVLKERAKSLKCVHWIDKFPTGFDVRDFVMMEAVKNKRPKRCFQKLMEMVKNYPRKKDLDDKNGGIENSNLPERDPNMTWDKLMKCIKTWLKMDDFDPIKVAVAIILSNFIPGDPVWMFLVACPGVGKSEILGMFKHSREVYTTSSITPNALISGAIPYKGREPSLLPKLDGKTLCIKDFSTIQTMRDAERDSLLGILRDAYDGSAGKVFGTGESKHFESKFSILAGVTPSIYDLEYTLSSLGERFLKVFIGDYLDHKNQKEVVNRAMENVGQEVKMRDELSSAMFNFIENSKDFIETVKDKPVTLSKLTEEKIVNLAIWCSRMKGTVSRDKYEKDIITNKAYTEIGTRTGKQLKRLILCFPNVVYNRKEDPEDYELVKRITLDSISAKREDVFRAVFMSCEDFEDTVELKQVIHLTKYGYSTALRTVDDLVALNVVERVGHKRPYQYRITKSMNNYTRQSQLYTKTTIKNRPFRSKYLKEKEE